MRLINLIPAALLFLTLSARSQNLCRISNREGLSNSSILSLAQDADGYIWAGSCEGLNLWDGTYARNFRLSGNLVQQIEATRDGYLWVRTNYGIDRLDTRDKSVELHTGFPRVYFFAARSRDEAFFIFGGRLYGYRAAGACFEPIDTGGEKLSNVLRLGYDEEGFLWLVRRDGISCARMQRDGTEAFRAEEWRHFPMPDGIAMARFDECTTICFIDGKGTLYRFDMRQRRAFRIFDLSGELRRRSGISDIIRDKDDYVIAFSMNGILRLHSTDPIEGKYALREIDVDCGVFALLKDRNQDIVWIGTDGSGLLRQSDGDIAVRSVTYGALPFKLTKPIKALFIDREGDLWIGTKNDGILRIRDFYTCREFTRQNTDSYTVDNAPLRRNSVYTFAPGRKHDVLWIGGDGGVGYYSYREKRLRILPRSTGLHAVHDLYEDADGVLWAATVGYGVFRIELTGSADAPAVRKIDAVELGEEARGKNFFFAICEESDSTLWFCNHGIGAVCYHKPSRQARVIRFDTRRGLAVNDVTAAARCSDGTMWFGTGCGIDRYCPADTLRAPDYGHDLLRKGVIHGVLADSLDNVWVGTNTGIIRYNPQTNRSVAYGASYGLDVVEFSDGAYFYDRRAKTLLFGGINGFVVISDTEAPAAGSYMPPIQFRDVTAGGRTYGVGSLMRDGTLVLNHRQRDFTLSLLALDYINGSNYSYLYNIEERDGQWNDNRYNNRLVFASLPAGRYTLRVRYRNNMTGELSPAGRLSIRILPPPYASAGAWAGYIIAALGIAALSARYYIRRRRERIRRRQALYDQRQKELLYESRIWSFSNLANELSIPLTLINGPCQQILEHPSADGFVQRQAEFIRRNAQKLNDLIYMLNEFGPTGQDSFSDDIELLDISRFADGIARTFTEYAASSGIRYCIEIGGGLLFPSVRNGLTMMLNILLTNAFKRTGPEGEVSLRIAADGERLRIEIANRGVCFDKRQIELIFDRYRLFDYLEELSRKGISLKDDMELAICRNLVSKLQGEFGVESGEGLTTFTLSFPRLEITRATRTPCQPDLMPERPFNLPSLPVPAVIPGGRRRETLPSMLVINEDRDMTAFISGLFAAEYNVSVVGDVQQVGAQLSELHPQIIICGAVSLESGMIEVIRRIRQTRHLAQIPVILLTAAPRTDLKVEGLELGVDICLTLPFNITHLQSVVEQLLRRYEALKDYGRSAYSSFDLTQGRMLHRDDRAFLDKMLDIIHRNMLNTALSTQFIADELGMSLCNFYRKLGGVTDQTPAGIIREYRLCLAEQLLLTTKLTIDEVIYKSGFANRSTFFRSFIARFGCTPKVYRERKIREAMEENTA